MSSVNSAADSCNRQVRTFCRIYGAMIVLLAPFAIAFMGPGSPRSFGFLAHAVFEMLLDRIAKKDASHVKLRKGTMKEVLHEMAGSSKNSHRLDV